MTYEEFIESKRHRGEDYGIAPNYYPERLFEYQKHVCEFAIRKGRCAVFLDTGLGKTIIQLTIAVNYHNTTGKPVLIITPLAVAFQFIKEAQKFGIKDISYSKDGKHDTRIVVCNYERLNKFNTADFDCVLLDESSILKNFEGATKNTITAFLKKTKYRFLFSATPSPNNHIELGTSSEALGYMGYMDMIGKFFKNNQNNVAKLSQVSKARQGEEYYLKPHAERDFWRWVSSWSISMRKPSDIGYSDEYHILPELLERITTVKNSNPLDIGGQLQVFNMPAVSFREIKSEVRGTIAERCEMANKLSLDYNTTVHWVNLNDEAKFLRQFNPNAIEIHGSMSLDEKEEILLNFSDGAIKKLITKASITAFGLNWQHCNHCTYFPTYSYEQYYQSIRRFWRFGQTRPVTVDLVISDGQTEIMKTLQAKKARAIEMFDKLTSEVNLDFKIFKKQFDKQIILPNFLNTQP
jgi:SNF2 family DNA or RNA helicase